MSEHGSGSPMGHRDWSAILARSGSAGDQADHGGNPPSVAVARPGWDGPGRRTFTELLTFLVASVAVALGAAAIGMMLTAPAEPKDVPADLLSGSCLDEPFRSARAAPVGTLARLCFDADAVRPRVELTGVTSGALYTGWISTAEVPATGRGTSCDPADTGAAEPTVPPQRFDAASADQTGRVQLSANLPGLKILGGSEVRLLVVDHGWDEAGQTAQYADRVATWNGAWIPGVTTTGNGYRIQGRLVGCASFWMRGGVETVEQR